MLNTNAYSQMLSIQAKLCFDYEFGFLKSANLHKYNNIISIGCGNGTYLSLVSEGFNKKCIGIDISEKMISDASKSLSKNTYLVGSAEKLESLNAEIVILRLIVHQLQDREAFISTIANYTKPGTKIIIIEPYDNNYYINPKIKVFDDHLNKHRKELSQKTAKRNLYDTIDNEMSKYFDCKKTSTYYIPSTIKGNKKLYKEYMVATANMFNAGDDVHKGIDCWYEDKSSYIQIGLFLKIFERK